MKIRRPDVDSGGRISPLDFEEIAQFWADSAIITLELDGGSKKMRDSAMVMAQLSTTYAVLANGYKR